MKQFVIMLFLIFGYSYGIFSQSSASAGISTDVVRPIISTSTNVTVNYEPVALIMAGVVDFTSATPPPPGTPALILPTDNVGTCTIFAFFLKGLSSSPSFSIIVPTSALVIKRRGNDLVVNSFKPDQTMTREPGLIAGVYVKVSPLDVTVNYN